MSIMAKVLPYREERPWGSFIEFAENEPVTVKIISVRAGEAFSLQSHEYREEFWHVISGSGTVEIGENKLPVEIGKDYTVPARTQHRITASEEPVVILEVARGVFDENDITRNEDRYGRI